MAIMIARTRVISSSDQGLEILRRGLLQRSGRFAVASQVSEVLLMKDRGIRGDQLLHLESLDLKTRRPFRKACQHLLNLSHTTRRSGVVVVVMRHDQLLGNP